MKYWFIFNLFTKNSRISMHYCC